MSSLGSGLLTIYCSPQLMYAVSMSSASSIPRLVASIERLVSKLRAVKRVRVRVRSGSSLVIESLTLGRKVFSLDLVAPQAIDFRKLAALLVAYYSMPSARIGLALAEALSGALIALASALLAISSVPKWVSILLYSISWLPILTHVLKKGVSKVLSAKASEVEDVHRAAYSIDARYRQLFDELTSFLQKIVDGSGEISTPMGFFSCSKRPRHRYLVIRCERIKPISA